MSIEHILYEIFKTMWRTAYSMLNIKSRIRIVCTYNLNLKIYIEKMGGKGIKMFIFYTIIFQFSFVNMYYFYK